MVLESHGMVAEDISGIHPNPPGSEIWVECDLYLTFCVISPYDSYTHKVALRIDS